MREVNADLFDIDINEIIKEFNENSDSDLPIKNDTISLDDISFDVVDKVEDKFDGRFYVNYVGINPCTIIKEDLDLLVSIIRQNMDYNKLSFLIKNLSNFRDYSRRLSEEIKDPEEREIASNMIKRLNESIESFESLLGSDRVYLRDLKLKKEYKKGLEGLMASKSETIEIFEDIKLNNVNNIYTDEDFKYIKILLKSMNHIYKVVDERKDKNLSLKIHDYRLSYYKYTPKEMEVMKKLEFPTSIAGNENIFSQNVNLDMKRSNYHVTGFYSMRLYNLLNDMVLIGTDKTKLLDFYK